MRGLQPVQLSLFDDDRPPFDAPESETCRAVLDRLSRSKFRSRFTLGEKDRAYARDRGSAVLRRHALDIIGLRLAPAHPPNDGRQTPMRGHPVFIAQHATGTCCRECLRKWHHIPQGQQLTEPQREYIADVILAWIARQLRRE